MESRSKRWKRIADAIGPDYANKTMANWKFYGSRESAQRETVGVFQDYLRRMPELTGKGSGLAFFGTKGTGKDFMLSIALYQAVMLHGMFAMWLNGTDLYAQFRDCVNGNGDTSELALIRKLTQIPILAISDPLPPIGDLTGFQASTLFGIIDTRYRAKFPTWLTLNVADGPDMAKRMGAQLADRIGQVSLSLPCFWGSYREFERGL